MAEPEPRYYVSYYGGQAYVQDRLYSRRIVRTRSGTGAKAAARAECDRLNAKYDAWLARQGLVGSA